MVLVAQVDLNLRCSHLLMFHYCMMQLAAEEIRRVFDDI